MSPCLCLRYGNGQLRNGAKAMLAAINAALVGNRRATRFVDQLNRYAVKREVEGRTLDFPGLGTGIRNDCAPFITPEYD